MTSNLPSDAIVDFDVPEQMPLHELVVLCPTNTSDTESFGPWDTQVIMIANNLIISSPNMKTIPGIVLGNATLHYRSDGWWGYIDPFQTPQHYHEDFPWLCLIPQKGTIPDLLLTSHQWVLWANITKDDVNWACPHMPTSTIRLGRIKQHILSSVQDCAIYLIETVTKYVEKRGHPSVVASTLIHAMKRNVFKLKDLPMILRNIITVVTDFQRCFLELYASHTFQTDVRTRAPNLQIKGQCHPVNVTWMGVFTTSALLTETLWEAGVPVWQIRKRQFIPRDINVGRVTKLFWDKDIVTQLASDPQDPLHMGLDGLLQNRYMRPVGRVPLHHYSTALPVDTDDIFPSVISSPSTSSIFQNLVAPSQQPHHSPSPVVFSSRYSGPLVVEHLSNNVIKQIS
ncbi:hypothetical protein JVU11DRAFT_11926 [Chiua virens]|nr:hypothetical protein JVU11DRAFT_11926 [Chiua virens]